MLHKLELMKVLQQVSIKNKKKLQQVFLSLTVLNLSHQCILPRNNAKSSYDHLIKTQYTKEISSLVLLVSQQQQKNIHFKIKDAQRSQITCFSQMCL